MDNISQVISDSLDWRYAVKAYDNTKKISDKDWSLLEDSLVKSPSSFGLQPWKFILVTNKELKEQLKTVSWGQSQVTDCSHFVVFTTLDKVDVPYIDKYLKRIAEVRGVTLESLEGYKKGIIGNLVDGPRAPTVKFWAQRQSYIAMGFLMYAAAQLKIDTTPMEGIEPEKYDELLDLKNSGYSTVAAVALGYRSSNDKYATAKKVRFDKNDIITTI